jgi:hypothetical protein
VAAAPASRVRAQPVRGTASVAACVRRRPLRDKCLSRRVLPRLPGHPRSSVRPRCRPRWPTFQGLTPERKGCAAEIRGCNPPFRGLPPERTVRWMAGWPVREWEQHAGDCS